MLRELNQSACTAPKSRPQKFQTFEKVLPHEQGLSEGQNFYPELYLDPGSCGGNTPSTGPKSLVPGESSCSGHEALVLTANPRFNLDFWNIYYKGHVSWNHSEPYKRNFIVTDSVG